MEFVTQPKNATIKLDIIKTAFLQALQVQSQQRSRRVSKVFWPSDWMALIREAFAFRRRSSHGIFSILFLLIFPT